MADKPAVSGHSTTERARELYVRLSMSKTVQATNHPSLMGQDPLQAGVTAILYRLFAKDEFV